MTRPPRFHDTISNPNYQDLVHRLRQARETAGLTQHELAQRMGVTATAVCNWERFAHTPSLYHLMNWFTALDFEAAARAGQ